MTVQIEFLGCAITGHTDARIFLEVSRFAEFLRGADGTCAFCHGDPCAEQPCETCGGDYMQPFKPDAGPVVWRYIPHGSGCEGKLPSLIAQEFMAAPDYAPFETCPCCLGRPT